MEEQQTFDFELAPKKTGPVTCLGLRFENDIARREHFKKILAEKLKDPEFRNIEGFPKGADSDILALSDPPYYCACPNPWINDFIKEWESEKAPKPLGYKYEREPFAADVSEGKNNPIYNAHSYHTKVPHKAIMRYILHYTEPGDIVFDGFCGTGMTGVAAQMCGNIDQVRSLGYCVDERTGAITDPNAEDPKKVISYLGARKAVLNDLSPAASFIAYNYNTPVDVDAFEREAIKILDEVEEEYGWMYETQHVDENGNVILGIDGKPIVGKINYVIWSDVFLCPHCMEEKTFWEFSIGNDITQGVQEEFLCPRCQAKLSKDLLEKVWTSEFNVSLEKIQKTIKRKPVLVCYFLGKNKKQYLKVPDQNDILSINNLNSLEIDEFIPVDLIEKGDKTGELLDIGITNVNQFYFYRNLIVLAKLWEMFKDFPLGRFLQTSVLIKTASLLHNIGIKNGKINLAGALPNALFVPSLIAERNIFVLLKGKLKDILKAVTLPFAKNTVIATSSTGDEYFERYNNSIDYIFIDPPFGANLHYSEFNFFWESWHKVFTNNAQEAIENKTQKKDVSIYRDLMTLCFIRAYKLLKPGRSMTVEFSNTNAYIWNGIQSAIADAGFFIANVAALNKGQGTFNSQTNPTSVKQDLVITAYKPDENFEARFKLECETVDGVWDFVRTHLSKLPICKVSEGRLLTVPERDPRILYDQVISYYVRKNINVPISSRDFQDGLTARYSERDGHIFLPEQAAEYDRKKARFKYEIDEGAALFIQDEASAISWLRSILIKKPQTYSSIHPQYLQAPTAISKYENLPDLGDLLKENFLCYDARRDGDVPSQIHTLLSTNYHELRNLPKDDPRLMEKADNMWYVPDPNKEGDLEKLRERSLLKEFEAYRQEKKLKKFRLDAIRVGCKKAFADKNFAVIREICEKIPEKVINEDDKLLMWYNIAQRLS